MLFIFYRNRKKHKETTEIIMNEKSSEIMSTKKGNHLEALYGCLGMNMA